MGNGHWKRPKFTREKSMGSNPQPGPNGAGPKPIAVIQIAMFADGNVTCQFQTAEPIKPSRAMFNGAMETAKQNMLGTLIRSEQEASSKKIVGVPPELSTMNLRG